MKWSHFWQQVYGNQEDIMRVKLYLPTMMTVVRVIRVHQYSIPVHGTELVSPKVSAAHWFCVFNVQRFPFKHKLVCTQRYFFLLFRMKKKCVGFWPQILFVFLFFYFLFSGKDCFHLDIKCCQFHSKNESSHLLVVFIQMLCFQWDKWFSHWKHNIWMIRINSGGFSCLDDWPYIKTFHFSNLFLSVFLFYF